MSKTDIYPPRQFAIDGAYKYTNQGYDAYFKRWGSPVSYSGRVAAEYGSETRRGQTTLGFAKKRSTGNLPQNAFSYSKLTGKYFNGVYKYERRLLNRHDFSGHQGASFMSIPDLPIVPPGRQVNLMTMVKQKLLQRVKDSELDAAVALAEGPQTIRMLATMIRRLYNAYSAASKGNFRAAAASLGVKPKFGGYGPGTQSDAIARGWLELQYGWRPLLSDINGLVQHINKQYQTRNTFVTFKYGSFIQEDNTFAVTRGEFIDVTSTTYKYQCKGLVKLRRTESSGLRTATELGFLNPALVAWEKVPFSFLIDYLVPVGLWLSQFDSTVGWSFVDASITTFETKKSTKVRSSAGLPEFTYHYVSGSTSLESVALNRQPLAGFAQLFTFLPFVKDSTSVTRILNTIALFKLSKR